MFRRTRLLFGSRRITIYVISPTARSLKRCRDSGWIAQVVEHWIPVCNIRRDLFGCIDIVAVGGAPTAILGVQATSRGNHKARCDKAFDNPAIVLWLEAGGRFEVWSWGVLKKTGRAYQLRRSAAILAGDGQSFAFEDTTPPLA